MHITIDFERNYREYICHYGFQTQSFTVLYATMNFELSLSQYRMPAWILNIFAQRITQLQFPIFELGYELDNEGSIDEIQVQI